MSDDYLSMFFVCLLHFLPPSSDGFLRSEIFLFIKWRFFVVWLKASRDDTCRRFDDSIPHYLGNLRHDQSTKRVISCTCHFAMICITWLFQLGLKIANELEFILHQSLISSPIFLPPQKQQSDQPLLRWHELARTPSVCYLELLNICLSCSGPLPYVWRAKPNSRPEQRVSSAR